MSNHDRLVRIMLGLLALFGLAHLQSSAHAYSSYDLAFKSWVEHYIPRQKPEFVRPYVVLKSGTVYLDGAGGSSDENRERLDSADLTRGVVTVNRAETRSRVPRSLAASHPGLREQAL